VKRLAPAVLVGVCTIAAGVAAAWSLWQEFLTDVTAIASILVRALEAS